MLAWVEELGIWICGGRIGILSLRLGFIALFAGSTYLLARLTDRVLPGRPWAGFLAALGLNITAYYGWAAGTFALPDGPLLFFWLLTLGRLALARERPGDLSNWALVGLAWGGTLLSKYHGVFIPIGVLIYILLEPSARNWLRRPGPYLASAIGAALFAPVVYWNSQHDWASFRFQAGRAAAENGFRIELAALAILEQALYVLPWIWLPLVLALAGSTKRILKEGCEPDRFLASQSLAPLGIFAWVACRGTVLPHWSLIGLASAFPLLGFRWAGKLDEQPERFRRALSRMTILPAALSFLIVAQARWDLLMIIGLGRNETIAKTADPTLDLRGWREVSRFLREKGLLNDPNAFLLTTRWYQSGQLAFATGLSKEVACYSPLNARGFAYWSAPGDWVGKTAVLVTIDDMNTDPTHLRKWFNKVEKVGEVALDRGGVRARTFGIFRCEHQWRPYPFANLSAAEIKRRTALAKEQAKLLR